MGPGARNNATKTSANDGRDVSEVSVFDAGSIALPYSIETADLQYAFAVVRSSFLAIAAATQIETYRERYCGGNGEGNGGC